MPTSRVVKPSSTTGVLNGKASVPEASLVQVSFSSSEEHSDYSRYEVDFDDEPALPDTSKFLNISEKEMQVDVPVMVSPLGEIAATEGISSIPLNYYLIELDKYFNISFEFHL